jgi:hypothetical protein
MLGDNSIIPGACVVSGVKKSGGMFISISEGYIYLDGELFYFPGVTGATSGNYSTLNPGSKFRIKSVWAANNPYLGFNIHQIRTMEYIDDANPMLTGDLHAYTLAEKCRLEHALVPKKDSWHYVGVAGEPVFANGFANGSIVVTTDKTRFRKDITGNISVSGIVDFTTLSTLSTIGNYLKICTLPLGYRPDRTVIKGGFNTGAINGSGIDSANLTYKIDTNGDLSVCVTGFIGAVSFVDLNGPIYDVFHEFDFPAL